MKFNVPSSIRLAGLKLKSHSPEIMLVAGVAGVVTSGILACRATLKAKNIKNDMKDQLEDIELVKNKVIEEDYDGEEYTEEDYKKDLTIVYSQTVLRYLKLYAPSVVLGILSIGCMVGSHVILNKRNAGLSAAYGVMHLSFKKYRQNVVERFGEDVDKELLMGVKEKVIEEKTVNKKTGKEKKVEKKVKEIDPNAISPYARIFDDASNQWVNDAESNLCRVILAQNQANDKLKCQGYLYLNDVYKMLDLEESKLGQLVGWVYDKDNPIGDNCVDFNLYDLSNKDFVNGVEKNVLLDFNVDGYVLDLIENKRSFGKDYHISFQENPWITSIPPIEFAPGNYDETKEYDESKNIIL